MSLKYVIFIFLLLLLVVLLGFKNYKVWTHPIETLPNNETVRKSEKNPETPLFMTGSQKGTNSIASYILIAEKNIFNPERKDFPVTPVEQSKTNVRPQLILYGVTISEDYQAASIVNPGRPLRKGEREIMTLKAGEKIGDYKLAKVSPDRIMLENNGDSFEVLLYDTRAPKKRTEVKTEVKPPTVTSPQPPAVPPPAETPKPAPPQESVEKPKEPVREQISPPPATTRPRPNFPFPPVLRGRRSVYPPSGESTQPNGGN